MTVLASSGTPVEVQVAEQLGVQDAAQQVRLLLAFAERLELPAAFKASRELMQRSEDLGAVVRDGQVQARQVQQDGLRRLVRGPMPIALSDVTGVLRETDPWLDVQAGRSARAIDMVMSASRLARGEAFQAAVAETSGFYTTLQRIAADVVSEVGKVKALPKQVWGGADPPGLMIKAGRGADWSAMVLCQERFSLVHQAGQTVRAMGGLGAAGLLNGPPNLAFAYKRWDLAQAGEQELRRLHPGLRLAYALKEGWEPGLWLSTDVPERAALAQLQQPRRGLVGLLVGPRG